MWPVQSLLLNGQWYRLSSPWLVFETKHHFLKGYGVSDGQVPFPFICSAGGFFFPASLPPKIPSYCVLWWLYCSFYRSFIPPFQDGCGRWEDVFLLPCWVLYVKNKSPPFEGWSPSKDQTSPGCKPRDSQRESPVVGTHWNSTRQPAEKGEWFCGSFGVSFTAVNHQIVDLALGFVFPFLVTRAALPIRSLESIPTP